MLNYRVKTVLINKKVKFEASCIIKVSADYLLVFGNYNVILENCTLFSAIFVKKCTELSALSLFIRLFAAKEPCPFPLGVRRICNPPLKMS